MQFTGLSIICFLGAICHDISYVLVAERSMHELPTFVTSEYFFFPVKTVVLVILMHN